MTGRYPTKTCWVCGEVRARTFFTFERCNYCAAAAGLDVPTYFGELPTPIRRGRTTPPPASSYFGESPPVLVPGEVQRCAYCGATGEMTRDHVIPRSRGGPNHPSNIVPCCQTCNVEKGSQTPEEWRANRERHGRPWPPVRPSEAPTHPRATAALRRDGASSTPRPPRSTNRNHASQPPSEAPRPADQ